MELHAVVPIPVAHGITDVVDAADMDLMRCQG